MSAWLWLIFGIPPRGALLRLKIGQKPSSHTIPCPAIPRPLSLSVPKPPSWGPSPNLMLLWHGFYFSQITCPHRSFGRPRYSRDPNPNNDTHGRPHDGPLRLDSYHPRLVRGLWSRP
ncbi:hypothetical protein LX32DRAFT_43671 [Colletotrichum zoysiae]|uniref:Secreted protein n=1 Tax=Colletotrichum zoysiae TaxID=1216348 RepID=A0AAD9HU04_9PEZI|nr:hypothetical protein LX32DRAFT_43671 [Colletotrichum zoysiae]